MNPKNLSNGRALVVAALLLATCSGCFKIVRPPPLVVKSPETGSERTVQYPAYVLVHDSYSFWDVHQIKDNIIGLFDGEIVHWIDLPLDAATPGPRRHPVETGIEWIKNSYAQLPDCAPVRIVGGFFGALEVEKVTLVSGARIAIAPEDPTNYGFLFTRVIYLTDWVRDTFGEVNSGLGYLAPWPGPFIPHVVTAPVNSGVDWAQSGALTLYIYVFRKISVGLDDALYGGEWAWGKAVSVFVPKGQPVNQEP
jgi:hypothetical protein